VNNGETMASNSQWHGKGAIEILEEASHLLRLAPITTLLCYFIGTMPFVLGLLFFWADMSGSGTARSHLTGASFGVAVLFVWMRCWQAVFASRLLNLLVDRPSSRWSVGRILRLIGLQLATMPWAFVLLPLAMIVTLPFGWCYAFFQNLTVFGDGGDGFNATIRRAWHQSARWPGQNHVLLLVISLFALLVFANLGVALYLLPKLLKTLFGVETVFSRSDLFLFNTTFWMSLAGLTSLCVGPLIKAAYVLRCHYGESLHSGQDLLTELNRLRRLAEPVLALLMLLGSCWMLSLCPLEAAQESVHESTNIRMARHLSRSFSENSPDMSFPRRRESRSGAEFWIPAYAGMTGKDQKQAVEQPPGESVSAARLDCAISEVMNKLEYRWRLPQVDHDEPKAESGGFLAQTLRTVRQWLSQALQWLKKALEWLADWLRKLAPADQAKPSSSWPGFGSVQLWLGMALGVVVIAAAAGLWRQRKRKKEATRGATQAEPTIIVTPDLADENISASDLPVARWLALARDLLARGELRLGLRALYLAGLAQLADRNWLTIARYKSNRDYEHELRRRAHAFPGLIHSFSQNVVVLERVWYGMHEIRRDTLEQFLANHKRIMADE
jgi:hypothetical protein